MLTVCTLLWDANEDSHDFSKAYDESWVLKLKAGFDRNLTRPHRFVLFTDKKRDLPSDIEIEWIQGKPSYSSCIQPYRMGCPMILVGLDTIVVGNIDHMADYCMTDTHIALPKDPYDGDNACNGVALVPRNQDYVFENWTGENDMQWMRAQKHKCLDMLFPHQIVSYKAHVKDNPKVLRDARIVYFHGREKPGEVKEDWVDKHWHV